MPEIKIGRNKREGSKNGASQLPRTAGRFIKRESKNSTLPENEVKSLQYATILTAYDHFYHMSANSAINLRVHPPLNQCSGVKVEFPG